MSQATWTDRQIREARFYQDYARRQRVTTVSFAPVEGREHRPWNPYWFVYEQARTRFAGPGQRLLDFGCGVGIAAVRLAHVGYTVDGFDLSDANINAAAELAAGHGLSDRCRFTPMLAEHLDYPNDSFDLIVGIDILHHVDIPLAIAEAHRVLKPGGTAIFKEHVETPVLDTVRNMAVVKAIAPNTESLDNHITADERKLNRADLDLIHSRFSHVDTARFTLLGRFDRLVPQHIDSLRARLQQIDYHVMKLCPPLQRLGATVVLICRK